MDTKKNRFLSPNKLWAIVGYLLCLSLIGGLFIILSSGIAGAAYGIGFGQGVSNYAYGKKVADMTATEVAVYYTGQGFGNALTYLAMGFFTIFYMRDDFKNDFMAIRENKKFYGFYIPAAAVIFAALAFGITMIFNKISTSSANQTTIENMMKYAGAVPIIISTVLIAPVVEEAIYRKCVFYYLRKYPVWLSYVISTLIFTLPHMLTTSTSFVAWCLIAVPYLLDGALLACVYHLSKKNIYASIAAHMLNNLIAVILVFV